MKMNTMIMMVMLKVLQCKINWGGARRSRKGKLGIRNIRIIGLIFAFT